MPTTRRPTLFAALAAVLVGIAANACGSDAADTTDTADTAPPTESEPPMTSDPNDSRPAPPPSLAPEPGAGTSPSSSPDAGSGDLDEQAAAAVDDLATRLGVEPGAITVRADERVTWRNGSLGCPQPGRNYTQALVSGRRLVLVADGREHAYHGARGGELFRCESPDPNGTAPGGLLD